MKRTLTVLSVIIGIICVLVISALCAFFSVTAGEKLDRKKLRLDTSSIRVFDANEQEIPAARKLSAVPFSEYPSHLPNAFVAVEDKRFYTHSGFDYKRIVKAAFKNAIHFSFREGASTISQQLIKNTHLTSEKTIARKMKEFKLTRILERHYSKNEILELYLNSIYFGHSAFGIADACAFYFGKEVSEVTPAESATLAALVRSPNTYSPLKNPEKCLKRRNNVLKLMREQNYIDEAEYQSALEESLPESAHETGENAYLSRVFEELSDLAEGNGSLRVYTFYNKSLQEQLENLTAESDLCAVVTDNNTHGICALRATAGVLKRLPASTVKPLLVYAPAIEENLISPSTPVLDQKTDFGGYSPNDYGGASNEYMSARYALAHSVNIPAVKILNTLGTARGAEYLEKLGLRVEKDDLSLALALGGMKEGFTLPALADAYSVFANQGLYAKSSAISRIEDADGKILYRYEPNSKTVFSEETCALINDMLQTAVREGTAKKLKKLPFPICAKTGTGAAAGGGNTDAYTISYTKDHTVGVWMGNRDNTPIEATGGGLPANAALAINEYLYRSRSPQPFAVCDGIERVGFDRYEYENNHKVVLADPLAPPAETLFELFKKSDKPVETSSRYSQPKIGIPTINVKNGAVLIELCQAEYYEYTVKRENRGTTTTIYSGKYQKTICDNSVKDGERYTYTVVPRYKDREGTAIELPSVQINLKKEIPDDWWE